MLKVSPNYDEDFTTKIIANQSNFLNVICVRGQQCLFNQQCYQKLILPFCNFLICLKAEPVFILSDIDNSACNIYGK